VLIVIIPGACHTFTVGEHAIPKMAADYPDVIVR
jgi:hypothetical protein